MDQPLSAIGQTYRDFQITKYLPLEELQSTLIELIHESTGARVLHIANDDPENLFCLSFQTLPSSSNGVAHILEHTVLCGSKKFPVKDPFFSMGRRSLNTFMNALTGQDFTCYPAASQVEKDFYHLLEVYLDAVFSPHLRKTSFLQEGHRLELIDPKDVLKSPLQYQGVVYNEMKGSMSSSESRLLSALSKYLTPDLPYAHNSGGDPKDIPLLTHEELVEFHRNFYHPSRCLFFFYGNLPLAKHLDFIAENALKGAQKIPPLPLLPRQKRFTAPVIASESYPTLDPAGEKDLVAISWLTAPLAEQGEVLALSLLDNLLMDNDASPLKKALLASGLCAEAESSLEAEMSEVPWTIICRGCEAKDAEKLKGLILDTLCKWVKVPSSKEEIEASLHQLEFERKEIGDEGQPYGLTLFFRAALLKQHGNDPENGLMIHRLFSELRARLEDPEYLPHLLHKYVLDNPHFVLLTLKADPLLGGIEQQEEQKRLEQIRKQLTDEELKALLAQAKELATYQEEIEHQSLECLPRLSLSDVPPHAKNFLLEETSCGPLNVFHHDCFTNQIVYADLVLDLPELSASDLPLLSLFARFLTELGCGGRDYAENLAYQQASVGSLYVALSLYTPQDNPSLLKPTFSLRGKVLAQNCEKLFRLFSDFLFSPDFTDERRIRELLTQHASSLQSRLVKRALPYASQMALSGFSTASYMQNQMGGLPYYQRVLQCSRNFSKDLIAHFERLQKLILGGQKADLILSCGKAEFEELQKKRFFDLQVPQLSTPPWKGDYPLPKTSSQARFISAPVAFTAYGMPAQTFRDPEAPSLLLATELLENCFLHPEIREKGGAYGGGASYSPSFGYFLLFANRDPNLAKTLSSFQKSLERIARGQFNERELEEAKLGILQSLDAPVSPGARAATAYGWKRNGRSFADRETFRKKILEAKKEDIAHATASLLPREKVLVSFLGKELFEREKPKIKENLITLSVEI